MPSNLRSTPTCCVACMVGKFVFEGVVEQRAHGSPYITAAYGEIVDLYGLGLGVVYAGTIELVAFEGACGDGGQHECHQCEVYVYEFFLHCRRLVESVLFESAVECTV